MAAEEPAEVNVCAVEDALAWLRREAPWLQESALGACLVGSHALALACARAGIAAPPPRDLDLAWALDVERGERLLRERGVFLPTTGGNVERGTLAMKLAGRRIEITTFRGQDGDSGDDDGRIDGAAMAQRIERDLAGRDMTIGAIACELGSGRLHDPFGGVEHFAQRRIVAVGDPAQRIREHPVRWLRYYRKAQERGFELDPRVRSVDLRPDVLDASPREAIALELRAALAQCPSPGRFFVDLHEARLLAHFAPELALQFDGRPAGPQRWHPELSQGLHLVLALQWAAANTQELDERDRIAVLVAVLCHDLGKGCTEPREMPAHIGHEHAGVPHVTRLLDRLPGLADQRTRSLAVAVCALHLQARKLDEQRPGTQADLYDRWFRGADFPVDLFALAVGADSAGRLGHEADGQAVRAEVEERLVRLRTACASVDAAALRRQHADLDRFREELRRARIDAILATRRQDRT